MQPVLGPLRFRHAQQAQPGAGPGGIVQPGAVIGVVAGVAVLLEPFLPGRERGGRLVLIPSASFQNAASLAGSAQSNVRSILAAIGPPW